MTAIRPLRVLLLCTALASAGACGDSPSEPGPRETTLTIERLALTISSTIAVGRTVTPTVGAYRALVGADRPAYFFYPADSGARAALVSSNPAVVRVNDDATVTAIGTGAAYVTAALGGHRDSVLVSVIPGYEVTFLAGSDPVTLVDVNDAGDVAGYEYTAPGQSGILFRGGQRIDLGNCFPVAMNNSGQVACNQYSPWGARTARPAIYANGTITFPLPDTVTGTVTGISETGRLFGMYFRDPSSSAVAGVFVGGPGGVDYVRPGYTDQTGRINSALHGVAMSSGCMYCHGMILRPEGPSEVHLSGLGRSSRARDINDSDDVIGGGEDMSMSGNTIGRAMMWRRANQWKPEVFSLRVTEIFAISERDQVVGTGPDGTLVWEAGRYTFLADAVQPAGWRFSGAAAISRWGVVAARAEHPSFGKGIVVVRLP